MGSQDKKHGVIKRLIQRLLPAPPRTDSPKPKPKSESATAAKLEKSHHLAATSATPHKPPKSILKPDKKASKHATKSRQAGAPKPATGGKGKSSKPPPKTKPPPKRSLFKTGKATKTRKSSLGQTSQSKRVRQQQCAALQKSLRARFKDLSAADAVIVASPMRRTLETATLGLDWLLAQGADMEACAEWQGVFVCAFFFFQI
ncbi:hypothetical protein CDD82_1542 [Ophiocordyceps australis]|uniref:Uncharacterized protein n=1 Tax=Ophiocordyceps australis TaxID=1399860 RepID=A0A2C5XBW5_9HYPO|nr:hypothetical protein CDD82_1542 [Ophiocordyceps australis]